MSAACSSSNSRGGGGGGTGGMTIAGTGGCISADYGVPCTASEQQQGSVCDDQGCCYVCLPDLGTGGASNCTCACETLMSAGGCADLCSTEHNGSPSPDFCEGVPASPDCALCLNDKCEGIPMDAGTCSGL